MSRDLESQGSLEGDLKDFSSDLCIGFIRKVYGSLICQLMLTVFLCLIAMYSKAYESFMMSPAGLSLMICAIVLAIVTAILLFCCIKNARRVPINYILLGIFTICGSYLVSYACVVASKETVLMAAIMTLGIAIGLTVYKMMTEEDINYYGGMLSIFGIILGLAGIFLLFTSNPILNVILASIGVSFYWIYLIYDTQLIIENKKQKISMDNYILRAIHLYLDIILIFAYLMELLENLRSFFS